MPDISDERLKYAGEELERKGFICSDKEKNANFILLGVNPKEELLEYDKPIFAGNIRKKGVFDYTKNESFATENAYLTAEAAIALAIEKSPESLINSPILICGFGRIGKALLRYLESFTKDITVCARNADVKTLCESLGAKTIGFEELKSKGDFLFIFNTVPHPVFNEKELEAIGKNALLIDLASFPGGVDLHFAKHYNINLITARGLPGKYSPKSAGIIVAKTIIKMIKEEGL